MKPYIIGFLIKHTPTDLQSDMVKIVEWLLTKKVPHERCKVSDVIKISPNFYDGILNILEEYEIISGYNKDVDIFVTHSVVWMINNPVPNCVFRRLLESGYLKLDDNDIKVFNVIKPLYYYDYNRITKVVYLNYHGCSYKEDESYFYVNFLDLQSGHIRVWPIKYDDLIFDLDNYIITKK